MHALPANHSQTRSRSAGDFRRPPEKGVMAILAWWRLCRSRAAERRALAALSDYGLRDIGLTRRQAEGESRKWSWRP
jgi:uncharacterized protein YjiS (DUF1127 family)